MFKALASVGACVVASLLVSCEQAADEDNLTILEWYGYEDAYYYPEYMAKYGRQPEFAFFADQEDALQRMRTGFRVDLVHLCAERVSDARNAGLIKPLDTDRIPRWGDVTPKLLEMPGVQVDGQYWFVPWEWGYSAVAYNPRMIEVEDATYDIFIDPRFKGKTALTINVNVNLLIAGIIGGWADPQDPTEAEMETAPEIFTKMLENARFVWTDSTQLEQAWVAGDVGISYVFGSASRRMIRDDMGIVVVEPLQTWMCGLSVGANGPASEDRAYDYINAMLDTASGVKLFDEYGYGHGNANTVDLLDPESVKGTGIDEPAGFFERGIYTKGFPPAKKARMIQLWFEAQAGLQ